MFAEIAADEDSSFYLHATIS